MTATASYSDTWAGLIPVHVEAFRTKRRGVAVTLYRWVSSTGTYVHHWRTPFASIERAVSAAQHHAMFSNVVAE